MMRLNKYNFRLVVFSLLLLVATACAAEGGDQSVQGQAQGAPTSTPIPTAPAVARETFVVERGNVVEELTFTGRWEPRDQLDLSFEVSGTVRQVTVRRGDTVAVGDVLADLDIEDLEEQLEDAQTNLADAQADADTDVASQQQAIESAQQSVFNARLSLQRLLDDGPNASVGGAYDQVLAAEEALADAEDAYQAALAGASQGGGGVNAAYEAVLDARDAVGDANQAYAESAAGAGDAIESYNEQVIDAENQVILAERDLQRAIEDAQSPTSSRQIRDIQTQISRLEEDIARSTLISPIDGVVLEVVIQPSDGIQEFEAVMTVGIPEPREVIASIPIAQAQQLSVGLIGVCNVINRPETAVQCRVRQIPASARDADQTTRIAASLEDLADPGAIIEVAMPLQIREDVLFLPPTPIREFQGEPFVLLETPDGPRRTFIEIGLETDTQVEIISGLDEGDVVLGL